MALSTLKALLSKKLAVPLIIGGLSVPVAVSYTTYNQKVEVRRPQNAGEAAQLSLSSLDGLIEKAEEYRKRAENVYSVYERVQDNSKGVERIAGELDSIHQYLIALNAHGSLIIDETVSIGKLSRGEVTQDDLDRVVEIHEQALKHLHEVEKAVEEGDVAEVTKATKAYINEQKKGLQSLRDVQAKELGHAEFLVGQGLDGSGSMSQTSKYKHLSYKTGKGVELFWAHRDFAQVWKEQGDPFYSRLETLNQKLREVQKLRQTVMKGRVFFQFETECRDRKLQECMEQMREVGQAIVAYKKRYGTYSPNETEHGVGLSALRNTGFLQKAPQDPWDNELVLQLPGRKGPFQLRSNGPNGYENSKDDIVMYAVGQ